MNDAEKLIGRLRSSGATLAGDYPYGAWLGAWLRDARPEWWAGFVQEHPGDAGLPLAQAANYRYLAYVESGEARAAADALLAGYLDGADCPPRLIAELRNTVEWFER